MFLWPCIMNWLYINYQLWYTDYYLFIKYYSPVHVSSLKCSSSGGYSCTNAAYGTVTLYESSWWPVGTQLVWELTVGGRLLVGRLKTPYQQPCPYSQFSHKLCTDRPPGTLIESHSTICCMCTTVSSWRWALRLETCRGE